MGPPDPPRHPEGPRLSDPIRAHRVIQRRRGHIPQTAAADDSGDPRSCDDRGPSPAIRERLWTRQEVGRGHDDEGRVWAIPEPSVRHAGRREASTLLAHALASPFVPLSRLEK
jgi:hypothetical protein